jgi:hypothetical protein
MTDELPKLQSLEHFLFEVPLYAPHMLTEDFGHRHLYGWRKPGEHEWRIDGHCPFCNRESTFSVGFQHLASSEARANIAERVAHDQMHISCSRNGSHRVHY